MTALLTIFGFIMFCAFAIVLDIKQNRRKLANLELESKTWLSEQMSLPKYKVSILTKGGKVYETKTFDPKSEVIFMFRDEIYSYTSLDNAKNFIANSIKLGYYFHKETNKFVPTCEIESMQATTSRFID